jgi:hypothetical protein
MNDATLKTRAPLVGRCDHCGGTAGRAERGILRCECGSMLARYVAGGIELKCRRCKRAVVVPFSAASEDVAR